MSSSPAGLIESLRNLIQQAQKYNDDSRNAYKKRVVMSLLNNFFVANNDTIGVRFRDFQEIHKENINAALSWLNFSIKKEFIQLWDAVNVFVETYSSDKITPEIMAKVASPPDTKVTGAFTVYAAVSRPIDIPRSPTQNLAPPSGAGRGSNASSGSGSGSVPGSTSASSGYWGRSRTDGPPHF